jgi:O-antigen biosynthesis protein WbqP
MDTRCFFGTIISVLKSDGVVEGGTGSIVKNEVAITKETISG